MPSIPKNFKYVCMCTHVKRGATILGKCILLHCCYNIGIFMCNVHTMVMIWCNNMFVFVCHACAWYG